MEKTALYPVNHNPAATYADRAHALELENTTLRMRLAVVTEALRAAEEELTKHRFGECEWATAGLSFTPFLATQATTVTAVPK
jgi:hypothetical protein